MTETHEDHALNECEEVVLARVPRSQKKYRVTTIEFGRVGQEHRNAIDFVNYTKVSLKMRNVNLWRYKSTLTSLFLW
jgi:hypothetical protein